MKPNRMAISMALLLIFVCCTSFRGIDDWKKASPSEFKADYPEDDVWPEMKASEDETVIHFKVLNIDKEQMRVGVSVRTTRFDLALPFPDIAETMVDEQGYATLKSKPLYPDLVYVTITRYSKDDEVDTVEALDAEPTYLIGGGEESRIPLFVAPGSEVTLLIDMNDESHENHKWVIGFKGDFAKTDRLIIDDELTKEMDPFANYYQSVREAKSVKELIDLLDGKIQAMDEWLANKDVTSCYKDICRSSARSAAVNYVFDQNQQLYKQPEYKSYSRTLFSEKAIGRKFLITNGVEITANIAFDEQAEGFAYDLFRFIVYNRAMFDRKFTDNPNIKDPELAKAFKRMEKFYRENE